ncbi:MAG: hypothetical protein AAB498_01490 [Patescibacteria group bacterium]
MKKKLILGLSAILVALAVAPMFAAFEAHVINVTATIENALYVHPESRNFGTMFPQEYKELGIFVTFSQSFSAENQQRVDDVDYVIKQKPKPRPEYVKEVGLDAARQWCHDNYGAGDYLDNCYPSLCPYLSKTPDNFPSPGNDVGVPAFHDPFATSSIAKGTINKNGVDVSDNWIIDLAVPCFKGQCSQDWASFVKKYNPSVLNPDDYMAPKGMSGQTFGCDLWIEVTKIY